MQRKTLLSACIALALSGQGWAADITEIETTTGEKKNTNVTCPADPGKLSPEELKRLPSECSPLVEQNLMPWLSTGAAALITALAVVELNDDDDHQNCGYLVDFTVKFMAAGIAVGQKHLAPARQPKLARRHAGADRAGHCSQEQAAGQRGRNPGRQARATHRPDKRK